MIGIPDYESYLNAIFISLLIYSLQKSLCV